MVKSFIALAFLGIILIPGKNWSQDRRTTPSQKTKEAVEKFHKAPQAIGKNLKALKNRAKARIGTAVGSKKSAGSETGSSTLPSPGPGGPEKPRYSAVGRRDPFRPLGFGTSVVKTPPQCREENLSPLQQVNLSQLKLVGIIWNIVEPRAMVENDEGLGFVIEAGTPIGECQFEGKVKAIRPHEVVIEEKYRDPIFGTNKTREVNMKLPSE